MHKYDKRQVSTWPAFALLLLLLLAGCKGRQVPFESRLNAEVQAMAKAWKADPLGCNGVRTDDWAARIAERTKELENVKAEDIEKTFGRAEYVQTRNGLRVIGYYYDADCLDGSIPEGAVFCVLEFFFNEDGILEDAGPVCG